jgi:peroxiredoxin
MTAAAIGAKMRASRATIPVPPPLKLIAVIALVAVAAGAVIALAPPSEAPEARFVTLSGENLASADLRGKVVLVNFWATSCAVCVEEMPMLVATYREFAPRGYETVAVAMSYDHPNAVAEFAQRHGLPFKVALDSSGEVARRYGGVAGTPTSFVIDRRGRILKRYLGRPDEAELHALIRRALADPAESGLPARVAQK